jgi:SAM-dependent methyltransferase
MPINSLDLNRPHTGLPADVIPLQYHVPMLLDQHRMDAFQRAITEVVRPGMHVLDLGAGTGVLSFFAAQQGARVTAIEREPMVLAAARSALANAGGQRIRLLHADARDFVPDEPVDVVLCEMMHVGQLRERQIEVIDGFKRRYRARFDGPLLCAADLEFTAERAGWVNAIRVVTKNILAARIAPPDSVDWLLNYLVVPLPSPCYAESGERIRIAFNYRPGDEIHALADSARVHRGM